MLRNAQAGGPRWLAGWLPTACAGCMLGPSLVTGAPQSRADAFTLCSAWDTVLQAATAASALQLHACSGAPGPHPTPPHPPAQRAGLLGVQGRRVYRRGVSRDAARHGHPLGHPGPLWWVPAGPRARTPPATPWSSEPQPRMPVLRLELGGPACLECQHGGVQLSGVALRPSPAPTPPRPRPAQSAALCAARTTSWWA